MKTVSDTPFDAILTGFSPEIQTLARRACALIAAVHPDAVEVVWGVERSAGYGLGPAKMTEHYAYLRPHAKHVNLGFFRGASLADPGGLLEGTGRAMRHLKLRVEGDLERPEVVALLAAALEERRVALGAGER